MNAPESLPACVSGLSRRLHASILRYEKFRLVRAMSRSCKAGTEGDSGILAGHAPYMTTLKNGDVSIYRTQNGQPERITVTGGFAEVSDRGLTVLAESAEA